MRVGRPLSTRATKRRSKAWSRVTLARTWLPSRPTWKSVIFASALAREAKARPHRNARASVALIDGASLAPRGGGAPRRSPGGPPPYRRPRRTRAGRRRPRRAAGPPAGHAHGAPAGGRRAP